MKRRILSILMVLCMLASLFPAGALAEEQETAAASEEESALPAAETEEEALLSEAAEEDMPPENEDEGLPAEEYGDDAVLEEQEEVLSAVEEEAGGEDTAMDDRDPVDEETAEPEETGDPVEAEEPEETEDPEGTVEAMDLGGSCGEGVTWALDASGVLVISGTGAMDDYSQTYIGEDAVTTAPWVGTVFTHAVIESGVTYIGSCAFSGCVTLTDITIADGVTGIGSSAFSGCRALASVTIPGSVTNIGYSAFYGCESLTEVTIPGSVASIGNSAFYGCSSLTSVMILDGVWSIGNGAFSGCSALTHVTIPGSVTDIGHQGIFNGCDSLTSAGPIGSGCSIELGWADEIPEYAFYNCSSLTSITIPQGVTYINWYAFYNCSALTSVTIPEGVTDIQKYDFYNCSSLMSVTIPDSVTWIGESAFSGCSALTSVTVGSGVTSIADCAFSGCSALKSLKIPASLTKFGNDVFNGCSALTSAGPTGSGCSIEYGWTTGIPGSAFEGCAAMTSVTIPYGMEHIGESAFGGCSALLSLTIPSSVTRIDEGAFYGCDSLTEVTVPGSVTYFGSGVFRGCDSLSSVTISSGVTSIGESAFNYCQSLTNLAIAGSVRSIGDYAFEGCSALGSVTIPASVASIGSNAFSDCGTLTDITMQGDLPEILEDAFLNVTATVHYPMDNSTYTEDKLQGYGGTLTWSPEEMENPDTQGTCGEQLTWTLDDAGLLTISGTGEMYYYSAEYSATTAPWGDEVKAVVIEPGVTSIGANAFYGCSSLTSVTLPESMTKIESSAFRNCSALTGITIPDGVTRIGSSAFDSCSALTGVTIPDSVTRIEEAAFNGCSALKDVTLGAGLTRIGQNAFSGCSSLTDVMIPNSVTSIGEGIFYNCRALMSVTLSSSLRSIPDEAFYYCIALTGVTIPEGVTSIGEFAFESCEAMTAVTIPDSVTEIGKWAFSYCYELTGVTIPAGVTSIGENTFLRCHGLRDITIPANVTSIANGAFEDCANLTDITLLGDMPEIFEEAFLRVDATVHYPEDNSTYTDENMQGYGGTLMWTTESVEETVLSGTCGADLLWVLTSDGVLTISGTGAMDDYGNGYEKPAAPWGDRTADKIKSVVIEPGVTRIGDYAFYYCSAMTDAEIPSGVTSIGEHAFFYCEALTHVTIPASVTSLGYCAFYGCSGLTSAGPTGSGCNIEFGWTAGIPNDAFSQCRSLSSVIIPSSVTSIGRDAFNGCVALTGIAIPNSVRTIGDGAFSGCELLTDFTIPDSVTGIGSNAFAYCISLTSITIPSSVKRIGMDVFIEASPDLVIVCSPGSEAEKYATQNGIPTRLITEPVEPVTGPVLLPANLSLDRDYLLMVPGSRLKEPLRVENAGDDWQILWESEDSTVAAVDQGGIVTAADTGTTYVVAAVSDAEGNTAEARCRVDVLNAAQDGAGITANLPVTQVSTEIYKTDYARFDVVLRLDQNVISAGLAAGTEYAGEELVYNGFVLSAEFVGSSNAKQDIRPYFTLRVVDDRTLEIVPAVDLTDSAAVKAVAGSYKSAVRLTLSDGSEVTTENLLTVKVGKALPKLKAAPVKLNRFIADQTLPIVITGGIVESYVPTADPKAQTANKIARLNSDGTVTVLNDAKNGSGKFTLDCSLADWAVPATVAVKVSSTYTAPRLTVKPASVTLNAAAPDWAAASVTVVPLPGEDHEITAEGGSGLAAFYDEEAQAVFVRRGTAEPGNHTVTVQADGKPAGTLKVKVLPEDTAIRLSAKAVGAVDTAVDQSPAVITVSAKNFNPAAGTYDVRILQAKGKDEPTDVTDTLLHAEKNANIITITCVDSEALGQAIKGFTYTAEITPSESSGIDAEKVSVKFAVKKSTKPPAASVTLKAEGSIDVLRPGGTITLTPTFKNWYDYDESKFDLICNNPNLTWSPYKDGKFVVSAKDGANVSIGEKGVWLTYEGEIVSKPVKLSLKMGAAKVTANTKTVTLSKYDRYDRQSVILSLDDDTLYDIGMADVVMNDRSGYLTLIELGNGEYAIGYANNRLPGSAKQVNVKLSVTLCGNGSGRANATIPITVKIA